ncbi:hypothetical protein F5879DRAFT_935755 [Lentinula edodes]|uniref:Uncharacterized protein n=1 Tax=Lentinula edodes TaxID=5353 RepID=A0A1Q3EU27_LENED|nr:hypothetical protein F5879DRAFT_935755 [Lentinula edodes]KAJ3923454.1 hypothetical protein F5877DRAFT_74318 [Lentinula edodes]GAW10624.1 hypothetical protein LENED_012912 [Lentinula edodes]
MMTSTVSSQDIADASSSRAAQRKARLMQIEYQQQLEDMEALKMSEEQRYTLMQSFSSVKVEFCDLDGLQWTGSALRKRTVSRPDSNSGILSQCKNLNQNSPRRARAQTLFCPSSPSLSSSSLSPSSSYFPSLDTPLSSPKCRKPEALTTLNNVDFAPNFDEKTVRACVSPVKAALDSQKHTASNRDLDSRPPAKQRRRSRSPVKGAFIGETKSSAKHESRSDILPTVVYDSKPAMSTPPPPAYTGGAPMERLESSSSRRSLTRTYTQAEITFGVSPTVATEVMRGRERSRGFRVPSKLALEDTMVFDESEEVIESDLVGLGPIRLSPPKADRERGQRLRGLAPQHPSSSARLFQSIVEEEDPLVTPTPERFSSVLEYPISPETPIQPRCSCADLTLLKRKRQSSETQNEIDQEP